jgi:hypothetical protein
LNGKGARKPENPQNNSKLTSEEQLPQRRMVVIKNDKSNPNP